VRKFVIWWCLIVFIVMPIAAQSAEIKSGFRKSSWGWTPKQVMATEKGKPQTTKLDGNRTLLRYKNKLAGLNMTVAYIFASNKLVRAKYLLSDTHSNNNLYLRDYDTLLNVLTEKYGEPSANDRSWNNDLYKDDIENWGMAVAVGHMLQFASWENELTTISEMIQGDNFRITLGVEYSSKKYEKVENDAVKQEQSDQL